MGAFCLEFFYLLISSPCSYFLLLLVRDGVNFPFITGEFSVTSHMKVDTSSLLHRELFLRKLSILKLVCYFLLSLILPSSFNWERNVLTGA
jgi:hypothetical protein